MRREDDITRHKGRVQEAHCRKLSEVDGAGRGGWGVNVSPHGDARWPSFSQDLSVTSIRGLLYRRLSRALEVNITEGACMAVRRRRGGMDKE